MVVEGVAIGFAEVARLADAEDDRFQMAVETSEHGLRLDFLEVPAADRVLYRLKQRVLADALLAAEDQGVVDLDVRRLGPMRQPADDVAGFVAKNSAGMLKPRSSLRRIA